MSGGGVSDPGFSRDPRHRETGAGTDSEHLAEAVIRHAPVGLATLDDRLRVTSLNPAMTGIAAAAAPAGRPERGELPGRPLRAVFPELADQLEPLCRAALATGQVTEGLQIESRPVGDRAGRWWEVSVRPVRAAPGTGVLVLAVQDVTRDRQDVAQLVVLQGVTAALVKAQSLEETLHVAMGQAARAVGGAAASVGLVDPDDEEWISIMTVGFPAQVSTALARLRRDASLPGPAVSRDGRARHFASRAAAAAEFPEAASFLEGTDYEAAAVEPLEVGGVRLGYLAVHFLRTGMLGDADRRLLTAMAEQVAIAADRARQADAARTERDLARQLQLLSGQLAVADGVAEVGRVLAGPAAALLGATMANVSLYDAGSRALTMVTASESTPELVRTRFATWSVDAPMPARDVFATGQPVLLRSRAERDRLYPALADVEVEQESFAQLLLEVAGRPLGLVSFGWDEPRDFSAAEVQLMRVVADLSAGALERARLTDEHRRIADTLQRQLLPKELPRLPGWAMAARYLPAGAEAQAGGDWYDAFMLSDGRLGLLIGDVAGHGVTAAALMGQVRALARAEARSGVDPGTVLAWLNAAVCELTSELQETFVTCCYLQVDPRTHRMWVASAGHPPPLTRQPGTDSAGSGGGTGSGAKTVEIAVTAGPPLGVAHDARYATSWATLPAGTTLLLYTDGLVERPQKPLSASMQALRDTLAAAPASAEALCDHLVAHLVDGGAHPADDVALIVAQPLAPDGPA